VTMMKSAFGSERERTALGVTADGPPLPRMDHRSAKLGDPPESRRKTAGGHSEVGKRGLIPGAAATLVNAKAEPVHLNFPARSRGGLALRQRQAENPAPERECAFGIIRGELDQWCGHGPSLRLPHRGRMPFSRARRGYWPAMSKVLFTPVSVISGLLAGLVASKLFEFIWGRVAGQEAPDPNQRAISWPALIVAMTLEGAIFRVVRGLVDRGARVAFVRATGSWPGEEVPDKT